MITIIGLYRVEKTNKVLRILSGASCLSQLLIFEDIRQIPHGMDVISKKEAKELSGNDFLF